MHQATAAARSSTQQHAIDLSFHGLLPRVQRAMRALWALGRKYGSVAEGWDNGLYFCSTDDARLAHVENCEALVAQYTAEASKRSRKKKVA